MQFLKRGREYTKLAQAFNGLFLMINDLETKVNISNEDLFSDCMVIAYLIRKEIIDRTEEYGWSMTTPIMVQTISQGTIPLANALNLTIIRFLTLSEELDLADEMQEMLDKGSAFYEFEAIMPSYVKNFIQ